MYANAMSLTVANLTAWECIEHAAWAAWTTRDVSANATLPRKSWPCVLRLPSENNDVTRPTSLDCGVESISLYRLVAIMCLSKRLYILPIL